MQHPSHACEEVVPTTVVLPDGSAKSVLVKITHCRFDNGRTQPMRARGRHTRFEPEKAKRCGCGRMQKHCRPGTMGGTRCSCGQLKPCGETYKKRKS